MAKIIIDGQAVGLTAGSGGSDITFDDTMTTNDEGITSVTNPMRGILTQAEYDALPEAEKNKGTYVISDGDGNVVSGGGSSNEVYSEEETRIGTWIDGKPLYRKVFNTTTTSSHNTWQQGLAVIDDVDTVCSYKAMLKTSSGNDLAIPYLDGTSFMTVQYLRSSNYSTGFAVLINTTSQSFDNRPLQIIAEYTKTTD